ncbi:uncharacterized protein LOC111400075 [Olea europaea var. sylvestris]|uniref:uncharacterized protein LOC111400075 n=1 Tax=Olea europaea var. sylvestris TaxID=158386 RepID=UPI000C1D2C82|nr:uncharacterized protein LOC111400075 [Olea europaea var. sylvestris]
MMRSSRGSNAMSQYTERIASESGASQHYGKGSIHDPICSKRKGSPRKLRRKSDLESSSTKTKANLSSAKERRSKAHLDQMGDGAPIIQSHHQAQYYMPPPMSYSQILLGGENYHELTQHIQSPNVISPASASVTWNSQGNAMPYYYPNVPDEHGASF